ncbi:MAG: GLPGLI family protein [Flavobacteriaceae bacterium]
MNNYFSPCKILLIIILLFTFSNTVYSQNKDITLVFKEQRNELNSLYHLVINSNKSHWKEITTPDIDENKLQNIEYISTENYTKKEVYKDFNTKLVYSNYDILHHNFYVKDKMEPFNWVLLDSTETILNYQCQIAKTKFRGRTYLVSFTKDIAISNGPWKFQGLPGLILKVVNIDDSYENFKMECIEILHNSEKVNIEQPFQIFLIKHNKKLLSWNDFVHKIDVFLKNHIKNIKSSDSSKGEGRYTIKLKLRHYKEIFNKEVQTEGIIIEM